MASFPDKSKWSIPNWEFNFTYDEYKRLIDYINVLEERIVKIEKLIIKE